MIDDWRKLLSFFSAGEKRQILLLLLSTTVSGLVQAVGVASIMPFIAVVADPDLVVENHYLSWAYGALGFTSTNAFLKFLGLAAFIMLLATNVLAGINAWLTFRVCHLGEYKLARRLMSRYLARPYLFLLQRNSSELVKMVVAEIDRVAIGTLMAGINVFSDAVTTFFIVVLLVVIQPWVMTVTLVVLAVAYLLIYLLIMPKVTRLGTEFAALNTRSTRMPTRRSAPPRPSRCSDARRISWSVSRGRCCVLPGMPLPTAPWKSSRPRVSSWSLSAGLFSQQST